MPRCGAPPDPEGDKDSDKDDKGKDNNDNVDDEDNHSRHGPIPPPHAVAAARLIVGLPKEVG